MFQRPLGQTIGTHLDHKPEHLTTPYTHHAEVSEVLVVILWFLHISSPWYQCRSNVMNVNAPFAFYQDHKLLWRLRSKSRTAIYKNNGFCFTAWAYVSVHSQDLGLFHCWKFKKAHSFHPIFLLIFFLFSLWLSCTSTHFPPFFLSFDIILA